MALSVDSFALFANNILPMLKTIEEILSIVGLLYIGKVSITTLCDVIVGLHAHVYSKLWKKNYVSRYGKWAVVTGCTDGIGKGYAEELAKEGLNIVLISRTLAKLDRVSSDLRTKYNIETEVVQVDFSDGQSIYKKISEALKNKDIGILVNNVGTMLPYPKYFEEVTDAEIWNHVNINIGSVPSMTKLVLPQMINKGKGAIINIASIASCGPMPLMGIYSASKAFVDNYSQALNWEYKDKGITVQTINPAYVATNMTSFSKWIGTESLITPSPTTFAYHALSTLGYSARTSGYWIHGIQTWFVEKIFSRWLFIVFMGYTQQFLRKGVNKSHSS